SAFEHRVQHNYIAPFQVRPRAEEHFPTVDSAVLHVANFFSHEVAIHGALHVPQKICRKNKSPIQRHHRVDSSSLVILCDLTAQLCYFFRNSSCGIRNSFRSAQAFSSLTRIAFCVVLVAAYSAATNPRAQTTFLPLSRTGQPSRSHRLTRRSFNKRFNLCVP